MKYLNRIKTLLSVGRHYFGDMIRYLRHSATFRQKGNFDKALGRIDANAHVLEKGLAMPEPRPGYGKPVAKHLLGLLRDFQGKYPSEHVCRAHSILRAYCEFQKEQGSDVSEIEESFLALVGDAEIHADLGGLVEVNRHRDLPDRLQDFREIALTRHSVRQFAKKKVSDEVLQSCLELAIRSPSVCNRQTWRVHALSSEETISKALTFQNGNRGFGHQIPHLLVITSKLGYFHGPEERNQSFVDGGLFAMSLIYALHSAGLGTVCLNWSARRANDLGIKEALSIGDDENIIMLLGYGSVPEQFVVASSPRRDGPSFLIKHE